MYTLYVYVTIVGATSDSESSSNSEKGDSSLIRSPIRVSPERKEPRVVHDTSSSYRKSSSKLPVKERLYVSKRTIGMFAWKE